MMIDLTNGLDMTLPIKEHVQFGTFDSREYGMRLIDRSAPTPSEKEIVETVPFMQGNYDFSMILGERTFGNRQVSYTFHLHEEDYGWRKLNQTTLENKLMREGRTKLRDTYSPGYYYLGKCVAVNTEDDHVFNRLIVRMEFDCYPFKIAELPEGNDVWDDFNFELDVAQDVEFDVPRTTFRRLNIGDRVTVGAWSTNYETGGGMPRQILGETYTVSDVRETTRNRSSWAYLLEPLGGWVLEQDIVQAQEGGVEAVLINPGTVSVAPTMELTYGRTGGATIIKDNVSYNIWPGTTRNEVFRLQPGENELFITANDARIKFTFHKELI